MGPRVARIADSNPLRLPNLLVRSDTHDSFADPIVPPRLAEAVFSGGDRLVDVRMAGRAGECRRARFRPQKIVHPSVDEWWTEPIGHIRSETRPFQRRAVPGDCDQRPWDQDQRAPARNSPAHGGHGADPLDEYACGGPR